MAEDSSTVWFEMVDMKKNTTTWKCSFCNYVVHGEKPPETCPFCHHNTEFEVIKDYKDFEDRDVY